MMKSVYIIKNGFKQINAVGLEEDCTLSDIVDWCYRIATVQNSRN